MSNSKKQKSSAWRMSPPPPPAAKPDQPHTPQTQATDPHRVVWRGVETTAEASDASRHVTSEHKPTMWRGHEVSPSQADALTHATASGGHSTPTRTMWRGHEVMQSPTSQMMKSATPTVSEPAAASPADADAHARESWKDESPVFSAPGDSSQELSSATSLDDLFKAILGDQAGDVDDRALLLEAVEAQVRGIRDELGLPEPVVEVPTPAPAPVVAQEATVPDRTLGSFETGTESKRSQGLFRMVAGLALGRFSHS